MSLIDEQFTFFIRQSTDKLIVVPDRQQVLRIAIEFIDNSRLIAVDYLHFDTGRTKYSYQWMDDDNQLIHRWDNAHEVPGIPTSSHHQHIGSEANVHPSEPMTLEKVLSFIALQLAQ